MNDIINILHLENDSNDAELVKETILQADLFCNIDVVETEYEFKKYLLEHKYNLILGDYSLPTYDGLAALEFVSQNYPEIPFILVSGSIEEDAGIESLLHGASDYISKRKLSRLVPAIKKTLKQVEEHQKRQLAERALKESEESLSLAQRVGNIGSWDYNIKSQKLVWSKQAFKQFGLNPDEVEPSNEAFQRFIHPEDKDRVLKAINDAFENIEPYSLDAKMLRTDGSEWYMHTQGSVLIDDNGEPIRFIGIQQDITERKIIEKALKESEERYKSLFESNLAGVYKSTLSGEILDCNEAFVKLFGYSSQEEVLQTNANSFYNSSKDRIKYLSNLKRYGKLFNQEVHVKRKDGKNLWITENVVLLDKDVLLGTVIDITKTKLMTEELLIEKNRAEKADKLKSEFLAQMSHEIRTPINTILNSLSLIKTDSNFEMSDDLTYFFEAANRASLRLIRTIELILNMSELQLGSYIPHIENIDIELDMIRPLISKFRPAADKKGLELLYTIQSPSSIIKGDDYSLKQIFSNLIDNAIKYTKQGKITLSLYKNSDDKLCLDVTDTGIGIEEEYLPRLFDAFSQEQHGYTRSFEGNGLGMAIVKGYCELNDAKITVKSKKNVGTTFSVVFPKKSIV